MHVFGTFLVSLPRTARRVLAAILDAGLLAGIMLLAAFVRFGDVAVAFRDYWPYAIAGAAMAVAGFWATGLYREMIRFAGPRLWLRMFGVLLAVSVVLGLISAREVPRDSLSVLFGFAPLSLIGCIGMRLTAARLLTSTGGRAQGAEACSMIIYGAGASGAGLAAALSHSPYYRPVAFIDDDPRLAGSRIRGLAVHSASELESLRNGHPHAIIVLAIPSASSADRRKVLERLRPLGMKIMTIPGLRELMVGEAGFGQLRELRIEDLLGRDAISPDHTLLAKCITGRAVLVTGAGGSIGSELARQILRLGPSRLVLLDQSEFALYQIEQEIAGAMRTDPEAARVTLRTVLGSVNDRGLVERTLRSEGIQTVYHAAAYKHVAMVEANEIAGVVTNTFGTRTVAIEAIRAGVDTFVLVSTDKAVRPSSVMGASKRMAELVLLDLARGGWREFAASPSGERGPTRFAIVRFGNVLGSSGSVVPKFLKQIAQGGPVTVTHPEATRYFMTIPEAVNLVIQAGSLGEGGEIFILDMGEPVRILDLARNLIGLQGMSVRDAARPDGDIAIEFTGLLPGEKLHESLVTEGELAPTPHPRIGMASEGVVASGKLASILAELESACQRRDPAGVRRWLGGPGGRGATAMSDSLPERLGDGHRRSIEVEPATSTDD